MEEKILDFIMEYAQKNEGIPFQVIEENFNIVMDDKLKDIISDAIWDRDNVSDVIIESDRYGNEIKNSGYEENAYAAFSFFISLPK